MQHMAFQDEQLSAHRAQAFCSASPGKDRGVRAAAGTKSRVVAFALHDGILFFYLVALLGMIAVGRGEHRSVAAAIVAADLGWFAVAVAAVRLTSAHGRIAALFYRLSLVGVLTTS